MFFVFLGGVEKTQAVTASSGLTYSGRILDSTATPVTASSVIFTITVYDPVGKCWLYTEQRNLDLSQTEGTFSFEIGSNDSSNLYGTAPSFNNQSGGGPKDLAELFSNKRAYTGLGTVNGCTGSYDPSTATDPNEGRLLSVYFRIGATGTDQAIPPMRITPVPLAMQSLSINGYGTGELLRVDQSTVTSAGITNNALSVAQYTEFWSLMNKGSTSYLPVTGEVGIVGGNNKITSILGQALPAGPATNGQVLVSNGTAWVLQSMGTGSVTSVSGTAPITVGGTATAPVISIPAATTLANGYLTSNDWNIFNSKQSSSLSSGKVWVGNASNVSAEVSLSGDATMDNAGVLTLKSTGTAGTYGSTSLVPVITTDAQGRVTGVTTAAPLDSTKLPLAGGTMTGAINMGGQDITNIGNISMAASKTLGLSSNAADPGAPVAGQVWYNSTSNVIKYYDGSAVQSLGVAGSGITSLNGLTSGTQTFAIGTSGTAPAFSSATSTHTLNIPMASTAAVTAGLISKVDYDTFNTKLSAVSNTASLTSGKVWIGNASNAAAEQTLSGDATVTSAGVVTVDKTQTAAASKILQLTASSVAVTKGTDIGGAGAGVVHLLYPNTATNTTLTLPNSAGSASQFLQTDGAGNLSWANPAATLPGLASTQIWVGNASGAAATVSLSGDISSITNAGVVTANKTTTAQANKLLALDGTGVAASMGNQLNGTTSGSVTLQAAGATTNYSLTFPAAQGTAGQTLSNNGSGVFSWITPLSSSTGFINGGNTFAGNSSLGNNDNFNLDLKTNNTSRMTILNSGNVGIGTASPTTKLEIDGTNATTLKIVDGNQGAGKVLTSDANGVASWAAASGSDIQRIGTGNYAAKQANGTLANLSSGTDNIGIGDNAGKYIGNAASSLYNVAIGNSALLGGSTTASSNTAHDNIAIGYLAQQGTIGTASTGANNIALGTAALLYNTAGSGNFAGGNGALQANTTGNFNFSGGNNSLLNNTTGSYNIAIGLGSLQKITTGSQNIGIGQTAGFRNSTTANYMNGSYLTLLGDNVGATNANANSASYVTLLGAGATATFASSQAGNTYATAIGAGADVGTINTVVVGRSSDAVVLGSNSDNGSGNRLQVTGNTNITGNVGIGTTTPGSLLDVGLAGTTLGTMRLEGNTSGYVQIQPAAAAGSWTMTLPANAGTNGYVLTTDGSGVTSWAASSGGTPSLSSLTAATATNTIANANFAQVWNWDTLTTQTGLSLGSTSMTTGSLLSLTDSFNSATSTGSVLKLTTSGASSAAVPLSITNAGTGYSIDVAATGAGTKNTLRLQNTVTAANNSGVGMGFAANRTTGGLTDVAGVAGVITDITNTAYKGALTFSTANNATPAERMRIDSSGNVGIGTTNPTQLVHVSKDQNAGTQLIVSNLNGGSGAQAITSYDVGGGNSGSIGMTGTGFSVYGAINPSNMVLYSPKDVVIMAEGGTSSIKFAAGSNAEKMRISSSGNVGIGVTSPQTTLQVAGVISPATNNTYTLGNATYRFTEVYATNGVINTSDRREKKDICNTDLGLDFINKLRPVSYRWNTGVDNDVHYGLIAQEAEQAITEVGNNQKTSIVTHDEATDRYGVRYSELISPLIKAVQELYNRLMSVDGEIASVNAKTAKLEVDNSQLKANDEVKAKEIEKLKQENSAMKARLDQIEKVLKSK